MFKKFLKRSGIEELLDARAQYKNIQRWAECDAEATILEKEELLEEYALPWINFKMAFEVVGTVVVGLVVVACALALAWL